MAFFMNKIPKMPYREKLKNEFLSLFIYFLTADSAQNILIFMLFML